MTGSAGDATAVGTPAADTTTAGTSAGMTGADRLATVYTAIDALVAYAIDRLNLDPRDTDWTRNRILALFDLDSYGTTTDADAGTGGMGTGGGENGTADSDAAGAPSPDPLTARFRDAAIAAGLFDAGDWTTIEDEVMGLLSQRPSSIGDRFTAIELGEDNGTGEAGGMAAMRWLYDYCVANTYVKRSKLDSNPRFDSHGLTVTINLAKPEFRTMRKAAAGNAVAGGYPKCTICHENEGFAGRDKRTLRTIPIELGGEDWFWQFSPYGYFHEHGICVNRDHTPMHVDRDTFGHLLDFVDRFPGYFLGCNAALPRIGGSVLAHDHYQGGGEILPMLKAPAWATLTTPESPEATVEIIDWPGTAMRVVSRSRDAIIETSDLIRRAWIDYDDEAHGIASRDPVTGARQSALSPSAIITGRGYEMNLILRNNAVSERYPEGVFHAHPEYWAIKQEPIGLIEAQGLFILPGRLVDQLGRIEAALAAGGPLPESEREFAPQWEELVASLGGERDPEAIHAAVRDELGDVCHRILGNTAVFKDPHLTLAFLEGLGFTVNA